MCGSQEKLTAHWSVCGRAAERKEVTHEDLRAVVARLLGRMPDASSTTASSLEIGGVRFGGMRAPLFLRMAVGAVAGGVLYARLLRSPILTWERQVRKPPPGFPATTFSRMPTESRPGQSTFTLRPPLSGPGSPRWGRRRAAAPIRTTGSRTCSASTCTAPIASFPSSNIPSRRHDWLRLESVAGRAGGTGACARLALAGWQLGLDVHPHRARWLDPPCQPQPLPAARGAEMTSTL